MQYYMTDRPTIWLVGRSSRLGAALENVLLKRDDFFIVATDLEDVDIRNLHEVERFVDKLNPEIIVNCAVKRDRKWCEDNPEEAYAIHALGARNLAIAANIHGAHLFYLSSDLVFDGASNLPYNEFDFPNPTTVYGKSKLAGENFVKTLSPKHTILRSSWMYGKRYLTEIIDQARTGKISLNRNIVGTPTSSLEIAELITSFFGTNQFGTFHISCEGEASLKEFIEEILTITGIEAEVIVGGQEMNFESLRPRYSVLDNFMLRLIRAEEMKDWKLALKRFIEERKVV
ncbi:MAG: NAD(P)-dependent oxidoreductase [Tissierellia bacterium]|nr:NAD(P)-dependent oxidoreductase [Tissierellia bacterium]